MPPTINVTTDDVRTSLNGIGSDFIPDATISQAISEEELTVLSELPDDWDERLTDKLEGTSHEPADAVELLVQRRAARNAFHSSPAEVRRQALDAVVSMDIQAFRGMLNSNVEKAYELLDLPQGGTSAPFATATRHAPQTETPEDRRG